MALLNLMDNPPFEFLGSRFIGSDDQGIEAGFVNYPTSLLSSKGTDFFVTLFILIQTSNLLAFNPKDLTHLLGNPPRVTPAGLRPAIYTTIAQVRLTVPLGLLRQTSGNPVLHTIHCLYSDLSNIPS